MILPFRSSARRRIRSVRPIAESLERRTLLAFGLTTTTSLYTVDAGGGLVFSVLRGGTLSSTIHLGDLTSFKLNGTEFAAPFSSASRYSHFESGLSSGAIVSATVDPAGNWIKVAADDTTATVGAGATGVIQYYIAKKNDNAIYMATYAPELLVSSTRFITYLNWSKFPNHPDASDTSAIHGTAQTTIESGDVFMDPVDGHTHSKYYAENRLVGHVYHGATGAGAGAFMFIGSRERGSGGPFWKDIDFQSTGAAVELYNIPYSDHSQTEPFRPGLHGPYALVLTNGSAPGYTPNYSFLDGVGLTGWVSPSQRGTLTGVASNVPSGHEVTVALSNSAAQYWATPDGSGNYAVSGVIPGTYTETLYQDELAVAAMNVTISAGATTRLNITDTNSYLMLNPSSQPVSTPVIAAPIFRIGTWDGTPLGFLNSDKITDMHPSDPRLSPWADSTGLTTFNVGTTPDSDFPMAEWKYQTSGPRYTDTVNRITFNLTAGQASTPLTLRIGITRMDHGRPSVSINGTGLAVQGISTQPTARGLTLGSWRGNNTLYTYTLTSLVAGTNTIDITCASGSGSGGTWLSPWHIYDAIDVVTTSSITNAPHVNSIVVTPPNPIVHLGDQEQFTAAAYDQFSNPMPANFTWSTSDGVIDGTGLYTAPGTAGTFTITASAGVAGVAHANVIAPLAVTSAEFQYQTGQALVFTFNRDVDSQLLTSGLVIDDLTSSTTVPFHLSYSSQTAQVTFDGILQDGDYRATIPAAAAQDSYGEHLSGDYTFTFFVYAGDANHDRTVDGTDIYMMSQNWLASSGMTFAQGDFNYDGSVDARDLGIIALHWMQTLASPTDPLVPANSDDRPPTESLALSQPQTSYLSDLTAASATNGFGQFEKDKSNGEAGAHDGHTIKLNGKTYDKGLGVHAGSTQVYKLDGNYTRFQSDVGVDDEVGSRGSVIFQVYLDNVKAFDSKTMTGSTATKSVDLDVSGVKELKLVVTDAGNGKSYDHADWAGARLISAPAVVTPPAPKTFNSDPTPDLVNMLGV